MSYMSMTIYNIYSLFIYYCLYTYGEMSHLSHYQIFKPVGLNIVNYFKYRHILQQPFSA